MFRGVKFPDEAVYISFNTLGNGMKYIYREREREREWVDSWADWAL